MPVQSWGRFLGQETDQQFLHWRKDAYAIPKAKSPMLAFGMGRSYGDSCLVKNGTLLHAAGMNRLRSFDPANGRISCEAGMSLADLLSFIIPRGWFVPVSPGTKFVTLGGAIANDIHGKNHHRRGTIGRHILELELVRSNGEILHCSPQSEAAMFSATIGGLGLTGIITCCSLQLIPIESAKIDAEIIRTSGLDEFFELDAASEKDFEYTMSWIDCMAMGKKRGRGLFMRGNHAPDDQPAMNNYKAPQPSLLAVPVDAPAWLLNKWSIRAFNELYYRKQWHREKKLRSEIDPFFYPLDAIRDWNRLYGKHGLLQYQCVIPPDRTEDLRQIFDRIASSGQGSFLAVLKRFGDIPSPGLMSFPREGYTLTLDFRNVGLRSQSLFQELDQMVLRVGGRLYPAKDAMMSAATFQSCYPQWKDFSKFIDPNFQSMFWQRVSAHG